MSDLPTTVRDLFAVADERHPATKGIVQFFDYRHLPEGPLRDASELFTEVVFSLLMITPDGPELTAGLRKLLEAKDCLVRAQLSTIGTTHPAATP